MPQGQQAVESVFRVEMIVGPVPMKTAFGAPERIDEIEAALANRRGEFPLETGERVERRRG